MQNDLRIGISCHSFCLDGGMGRYVLLLTRGLSSLGYRPVVISKKIDTSLPEYEFIDPMKINTTLIPQKLVDRYFNYRLGQIRREKKLDLILSCNRNTYSNIAMCGGTHIGYLRAMKITPGFFDKQQIRLEKAYYEHCDLVIAHSKQMNHELVNFYSVPENKISVIYPPFSIKNFSVTSEENRNALRQYFRFSNDKVIFLLPSAGNHFVKGFDLIAEYFSKTTLPIELVVAGRPIPSSYKNVRFIGFQKDMSKVYQAADFTILPSRYEAFGQVGPESVACGTPVIFSNVVGSSEVIDEKAKLIFDWAKEGDVNRVVEQALKWANQGARLQNPLKLIHCQTDVVDHVKSVLNSWIEVTNERL